MKSSILCVDDEPNVLEGLKLNLGRVYEIRTSDGGSAALLDIEKKARHR